MKSLFLSLICAVTLISCGGGSDTAITTTPPSVGICGANFVMPALSYSPLTDMEIGDTILTNTYLPSLSVALPSSCSAQARYTAINLPAGLTMSAANGAISGTLTAAGQGAFTTTLTIPGYTSATTNTAFEVSGPPASCIPAGYVMPTVSYTPNSINVDQGTSIPLMTPTLSSPLPTGCPSHVIQWSSNGLPNGITVSSSGVVSGTPTTNGIGGGGVTLIIFGAGSTNATINYKVIPAFIVEIGGVTASPGSDGMYSINSGQSLKITGSNLMGSNSSSTTTATGASASSSMQISNIGSAIYHITPSSASGNILSVTFTTFPKTLRFRFN